MKAAQNALLEALVDTGIMLSSERSIDALLERTVDAARELFGAEGASLYLAEEGSLNFKIFRNPALEEKIGPDGVRETYRMRPIAICPGSIAGYAAHSAAPLVVADVYDIPAEAPYRFNTSFDELSGYRTRNVAAQPLVTRGGGVVGVLQLVNVKDVRALSGPLLRALGAFGAQAAIAVENTLLTDKLKRSQYETITRLAAAAELKDPDTGDHIRRISDYSRRIAIAAGLSSDDAEVVYYASPLHDVGKIAIPDDILLKPGKLTDDEWLVMKTHTTAGAEILKNPESALVAAAHNIALCHHERYDGKGYPGGVKGDDIPLLSRIVSVADVFDALTSRRPYKEPFPLETAVEMIVSGAEKGQFDPDVVNAFVREFAAT
ncbi:MAG TPA: HD domain-containing protein [Planctomycetes bacterium]|mgnify:CR=1 FL=1|nr:HD domain-containing protein [Planctomycetota bacterium]